jgi:dUTP pyrophosphatase
MTNANANTNTNGNNVTVEVLLVHPLARLPNFGTSGAAGADLHCVEEFKLEPGDLISARTGIRVAVPPGYEMQIRPRSGLAAKYGITVVNSPGTVDCDYRGEIQVLLANTGHVAHQFIVGDRIAQAVIAPVLKTTYVEVRELDATLRGEGGFGSTGR